MDLPTTEKPRGIALALSGGGSRAMAFHLGCLKALHDEGLLDKVSTISSVSGGSVIAALYCSCPGGFSEFEERARSVLKRGFVWPAFIAACTSLEGVKSICTFLLLAADRVGAYLVKRTLGLIFPGMRGWKWLRESLVRRRASRTTILRLAFSREFSGRKLPELRADRPRLVMVACELRAKAAFYFTAQKIHCWRYGSSRADHVEIAQAVSASAAYPAALPALDETMIFKKNGVEEAHRVSLTDGGVYDNLGLAPLWPGRDHNISLDAGSFDRIIACRAGYSLEISDPDSFFISRMNAAFESVFARAQNLATTRLFDLKKSGELTDFLLPYLGQKDDQLTFAPNDLVSATDVAAYPTNFSAMEPEWIDRLSRRGEQLVHALLKQHWSGSTASV